MKDARRRTWLVVGACAYVAAFHWSYVTLISTAFDYLLFFYYPPPLLASIAGWALAIAPAFWLPIALRRPTQVIYWLLYVLVVVPVCLVPLYTLRMPATEALALPLAVVISFFIIGQAHRLPLLPIPRIRLPAAVFWVGLSALAVAFYAGIASIFGLQLRLVSLFDVYEIRSEYKQTIQSEGRLVVYALSWLAKIINPLFISAGLALKRPTLVSAGIVGQLLIFSTSGHKSVLFSTVLIVALLIATRAQARHFGLTVIAGAVGLVISAGLVDRLLGINAITSIFVRRMIAMPGLVTGLYYEHFTRNPVIAFGVDALGGSPEGTQTTIPHIIGDHYFGKAEMSANANMWADSFANLGFAGIAALTALMVGVLWILDSASRGKNFRVACMVLGMSGWSLCDSAALTSLLTHGILVAAALIYFMPNLQPKERTSSVTGNGLATTSMPLAKPPR